MAQLLIPGDIDFTISEINENGIITVSMFNHADDATSIFADVQLDKSDIVAIGDWLLKEVRKINKTEAP